MLKGAYDETTLSKALFDSDDLLTRGAQTPSEAEQEILTYVMRNQNNGERTSVQEMIRNFSRRPYGWYPMAILTLGRHGDYFAFMGVPRRLNLDQGDTRVDEPTLRRLHMQGYLTTVSAGVATVVAKPVARGVLAQAIAPVSPSQM
jgi:hypothetical protein